MADKASTIDDSFSSVISKVGESLSRSADTADDLKANRETSRKIADSILTKQRPEPPEPPVIPPPPSVVQTDPLQAFGSFASTLAVFGSLLTRAPLVSALNASSDAMGAIQQRDAATYKRSIETWQKQSEFAFKTAEYQDKRYRDILADDKADVQNKLAYLRAEAAANHDQVLLHQVETGDLRLIEQTIFHREQLKDKSKEAFDKLTPQATAVQKYMAENPEASAADIQKFINGFKVPASASTPEGKAVQQYIDEHPDAKAEELQKFIVGFKPASGNPQSVALRKYMEENPQASAEEIQKFMTDSKPKNSGDVALKKYMEEHPNATAEEIQRFVASGRGNRFSPQTMAIRQYMDEHPDAKAEDIMGFNLDYAKRIKAARDFGTGQQGNAVRSFNVAIAHLGTLQDLSTALSNGDVKAVNRLANTYAEESGGSAPTSFNAARQIVGQEIVKAIIAGGGGVTERQEAQEKVNAAYSPEQLAGVIDTYKALMSGQLDGLRRQYEQTTGLKNFDSLLSDETKGEMKKTKEMHTAKLPDEAKKKLKKGTETTFGNGQVWTLDDSDEPVRVR